MIKKPTISVIMTVYNGEAFLFSAIESVLTQTYSNWELIIINDASSDKTLNIIQNYLSQDKRIKLINNQYNLGRAISRNLGLKKALGDYIAILDSDDISLPERLEKEKNFLDFNRSYFLVGCGAWHINKNNKIIGSFQPLTKFSLIKKKLPKQNCFYHSTIMFRNINFLYREKFFYAQDYDFFLQLLLKNKKMTNLKQPLIKYRLHHHSASVEKQLEQFLFAQKAQEFYYQKNTTNHDKYSIFDPNSIIHYDLKSVKNPTILKLLIRKNFFLGQHDQVKKICHLYFKLYGYGNKNLLFYFLSFFKNII